MSSSETVIPAPARSLRAHPYRRTFTGAEAVISGCGLAGTWQLVTERYAPDVSAIEPLGLETWTLPGFWLFGTVAAPAAVAAWLAWKRHDRAPEAVLAASGLLALELVVQVPFLGPHPLQAVFGVPALVLAGLAVRARRTGW